VHVEVWLQPGKRDEWLKAFAPLARQSFEEDGTLVYQLTEDLKDPNHLFIFELYSSEKAWKETHESSAEFKALFGGQPSKWSETVKSFTVQSAKDTGIGFLSKTQ